jgi:uncharacterized RmlC-like cupin family protein
MLTTSETGIDLTQFVERGDGISVVRGGGAVRGWNGIRYRAGLSAKNVGATKLSMNVATIPPGGVAYAHIHVDFEVMLYILQGRVRHEYGPGLRKVVENEAGDFIFIEPGVPHEVFNVSDVEPVVAVVASGGRGRREVGRVGVGKHRSVRPEDRLALATAGWRLAATSLGPSVRVRRRSLRERLFGLARRRRAPPPTRPAGR